MMIARLPMVRHGSEMTSDTLGGRIREVRLRKDIAQADLATAIGLRQLAISQLENGHVTDPKISTILALAKALGVSVSWLVLGDADLGAERGGAERSELPPYRAFVEFAETEWAKNAAPEDLAWLRSVRLPDGMEPTDSRFYLTLLTALQSLVRRQTRRDAQSA